MEHIFFGFVDNAILILGVYCSFSSVEYWLERWSAGASCNPLIAAAISGGIGNTVSDLLGWALQGKFFWASLVALGCLLGMLIIPVAQLIKSFLKSTRSA
jgi:hypothetical protein